MEEIRERVRTSDGNVVHFIGPVTGSYRDVTHYKLVIESTLCLSKRSVCPSSFDGCMSQAKCFAVQQPGGIMARLKTLTARCVGRRATDHSCTDSSNIEHFQFIPILHPFFYILHITLHSHYRLSLPFADPSTTLLPLQSLTQHDSSQNSQESAKKDDKSIFCPLLFFGAVPIR